MLEILRFLFEDFWRFLGMCVLLAIASLWRPVEINVTRDAGRKGSADANE